MPTSYQTSATPRGGRWREDSENRSSTGTSHEGREKFSKKVSKSSEGIAPSFRDRPASPASFVSSRSVPTERNALPKPTSLYTPSTMSLTSPRSLPYLQDDTSVTVPATGQSPLLSPVRQVSTPKLVSKDSSSSILTQTAKPESVNETVEPALPSPVSDVSPKERPHSQSSFMEESRTLQPSVEEVLDDAIPTPIPSPIPSLVKPSSREQISSVDPHPQHAPEDAAARQRDSKEVLNTVNSNASQSSSPSSPATPVMSPPISPKVHYQTGAPIDYGPNVSPPLPQYPYPYPPNMPMMPGPGPYYPNQYYAASFSPPMEQRQPYDVNGGGPPAMSASEDDREHLLQKVSNVLPDIHRLLNEYKESRGLLSAKEMLAQQAEKEHEEKLTRLRIELDANKKEYEKVIQSVVSERGKLEREAVILHQQVADLQALAEEHGELKTEVLSLQESQKSLEADIENLRTTNEELLSSKAAQEGEIQNIREAHSQQITELQKQHEDHLAAKEKEHQQTLGDQKSILSKTQLDLAGLISKHANLKNELENSRNLQNDHKIQLDAKTKELEEAHTRHVEEVNAIKKSQEEELGALEAKNTKLVEDYNHKEQEWTQELGSLRIRMRVNNEDLERERNEHQALRDTRQEEQDRASELARGIASWKAKHAELQTEHENVDRLVQSLRLVNDAKPKGDNFFVEAFQQLASSIAALSIDHFYDPPPALPKDILRRIPSGIPDFLGHTEAARHLRVFYIQHTVFKVLTTRIFQPFLFTLGCRCGGVDPFLQRLSVAIRAKSERREAAWRQITLRAAYTGSQAKKVIRLVGEKIVEEVLDEIKWFTDEDEWSSLDLRVQCVVKAAAELWRYAKLERELVTASMPNATGLGRGEWDGMNQTSGQVGGEPGHTFLLGVRTHVARDAVHTAYLAPHESSETRPITFLRGMALYNDSEVILARRREMMEAQAQSRRVTKTG